MLVGHLAEEPAPESFVESDGVPVLRHDVRRDRATSAASVAECGLDLDEFGTTSDGRPFHGVRVPATQVAEWAGHSVAVLLQVYATCIAGQEDATRQRIADALGEPDRG